ncbi:hypothetical protein DKM44_03300 [Deinococcus irradiatisoli]|uniref:DUF11 domain-containing protein n=1 Tax=Deinococcus irradiatisoli TaxID=2202254 RepID=A0A2Z3JGA5_9DEIO|nr:hypothetical protein [Deinococcus irradiatisoli]AWN22380.1 hypothetical protein DKM44_03300 [Deinococcus irradiatisoli]
MKLSVHPLLLTTLLGAALAQGASPLKLVLSQALVQAVTENGKSVEKLVTEPKAVLPGAVLEQAVAATNTLDKAIGNVIVNLPVPAGTTYLTTVAVSSEVKTLFSADKGKTFAAAPLTKTITVTENGKAVQKEVEVKPAEYTNVRWVIAQLPAQNTVKLGFRVKVN